MSLLDAMGTREFEGAMRRFLSSLVRAQGHATFVHEAGGTWLSSCSCDAACACAAAATDALHWIHFDDGHSHGAIGIALDERLQPVRSTELTQRLAITGKALSAVVRKHLEVARGLCRATHPLGNLPEIEQCLLSCTPLPRREVQVCARILFGVSSPGIAIDLDLRETTVKTYRKRAYQRLAIGSERELLTWYLRSWVQWLRKQGDTPTQNE
jgi:DNA-binding CsgD family transcriptional regulator